MTTFFFEISLVDFETEAVVALRSVDTDFRLSFDRLSTEDVDDVRFTRTFAALANVGLIRC